MEDKERIAVLESKVESLESMKADVAYIKSEMTKYKGFLGGVVFLATCVWTMATMGWEFIAKKLGIM